MCLSPSCFSHSTAQRAQAIAHESQINCENAPCRATIWAAAEQKSAQSKQVRSDIMCSRPPLASIEAQWWAHESQAR